MSNSNSTVDEEESYFNPPFAIPILVRFWVYLISNILSILCSFFVLYHLLFDRTLRQVLHNHVIIFLLIIGLIIEIIDIPLILHFFRFGYFWKVTPLFSYFWSFIDYGCFTTQIIVFAWLTIERHILIFYARWVPTKKKCFFIHYLPLIILLIYCFVYYCVITFHLPCGSSNFQSPVIGVFVPCIYDNEILLQWDLICHLIIPTFIIVIFSITLLLRVLWQKAQLRRRIQWRKQRKIMIQSLSISILYLIFNFPWVIIQLCHQFNILMSIGINIMAYEIYFSYYIIFLFPFVCFGTIPELKKRLKKLLFWRRTQRDVGPAPLAIRHIIQNPAD